MQSSCRCIAHVQAHADASSQAPAQIAANICGQLFDELFNREQGTVLVNEYVHHVKNVFFRRLYLVIAFTTG